MAKDTIIDRVEVSVYRVPTETLESDGTLEWDSTTMVLVELSAAGGLKGLGFTYASESTACLIREKLADIVRRSDCLAINDTWWKMVAAVRNLGRPGISSMAISAVDVALWEMKAKALGVSLVVLLGQVRPSVPCYGSGGFTSYSNDELSRQLGGWAADGIRFVKMKIGREPQRDVERVAVAREAIGKEVELFVDANGACSRKQALYLANEFQRHGVTWFEEPVSSDDLEGLRLLRDRSPAGMEIAAGEYGYEAGYFRRMLASGSVDVLQPDATRCGGVTGFLQAAALADAFAIPISAHTAPSIHQHLCCAVKGARHVEYFHDHARIEQRFFDGAAQASGGNLTPDKSLLGLGLEFRREAAKEFGV